MSLEVIENTNPVRILVVEDHRMLREGLIALLAKEEKYRIVGEAEDGREAIQLAVRSKPDVIVMDATMPGMGGIDAMIAIKKREPDIRVVILTIHKTEEQIRHALQAGADGYMIKTDSSAELKTCINSVVQGNRYLSPAVSNQLVNVLLNESRMGNGSEQAQTLESLSKREREVLKLAAEGYKNQAIAEYLAINIKTVEKHKTSMRRKLQLFTSGELTNFAVDHGLIDS